MVLVLWRNRLRWCGRVLRREGSDLVRRCVECGWRVPDWEVEQADLDSSCVGGLSGI